MRNYSKEESLNHFSRTTLAEIIADSLNLIKEHGLLEKRKQGNYSQARVAEYIDLSRHEDLSNAKNDSTSISFEKMTQIATSLLSKFTEIIITEEGQVELSNDLKVFIKELAGKLALNLIDISTEFDEEGIPYEEILVKKETFAAREAEENVKRERFIAVIGAGASNAFTSKSKSAVPNTGEAIARLQKAFEEKLRDTDMLAEKVKRVADRMRTSPDNFEAQLLAMAQFSTGLVTKELTRLCGNKNVPCLGYEILAHMFKHRFIDVIVNFNYDELLDNAISEELPNPGDYRYIYTAGHCPNKLGDLRIANRIKQPIYVKCHGTISQPNSLRFTETKAFMMEEAIQDHILELFKGKVPDAISQEYLPINLLVFGFSMRNHVFNEIIRRSLATNPEKLTIWLFDLNPDLNHFVHTEFAPLIESGKIEIKFILLEKEAQMEEVLIDLWEDITNNFDDYYKPQGIARHLFVDHVFQKVSPISLYKNQEKGEGHVLGKYYQDRLFVELFILILQSNGTIHLSQLTHSRAGKFLLKLKNEKKDHQPIFYYLKEMGMIPYENFMFDTFVVEDRNSLTTKEALIDFLIKKLNGNLEMRESRRAIKGINTLAPLVLGILKRRLLLVNPQYDHVHDNIFSRLPPKNVMNTSLAWIYNYRQNIVSNSDRWDVMLSVSEEGGFLRKDFMEKRFEGSGKFFEMILAATGINEHSSGASDWIDQNQLLSGVLKYRPWWLHNKHMVILLKRKSNSYTGQWDKDWKLVEGFFYHHKMLSRRVNPVKIDDQEDLKTLLYMFAIYWRGTIDTPVLSEYEELDLRVITSLDDIKGTITDILEPYEEKRKQKE